MFISDIVRNWYSNFCSLNKIGLYSYIYNWVGFGITILIIITILVAYSFRRLEFDAKVNILNRLSKKQDKVENLELEISSQSESR